MKHSQEHNLAIVNPKLAEEWHPAKNGVLRPKDVTPSSSKKVWWQCSGNKEHLWEATIAKRINGRNCPYCAGRKVCDDNCLAKLNPNIAKEWHPTKNGILTPRAVTLFSHKKVWWQCSKNKEHEWESKISWRKNRYGCPYCSGRRVTKETCLLNLNSVLAQEWHPTKNGKLKPTDVTSKSGKKIWWQCSKKHEWEAIVGDRNRGNGCPYCAGQRATKENCLLTVQPELAKQWHPFKNSKLTSRDVMPSSGKMIWWICERGHEWKAIVSSRNRGQGCPYCYGRYPTTDNCLLKLNPALSKEWHPTKNVDLTPKDVNVSSSKKVWWICKNSHEWIDTISHRSSLGRGCPHCSGRRLSQETCLSIVNSKVAQEWHSFRNGVLNPDNCHAGSNKKVWWQCKKGHEWEDQVNHRVRGSKCPYCLGRRFTAENSLHNLNPALASEWHPSLNQNLTPMDVMPWSHKKVWWHCKKEHEWESTPYSRSKGSRCIFCNSSSSMMELRIYSEIKYLFDDAKLRNKIKGKEIDIYIPSLHFGVEVDGVYWHKKKYQQDKKKTQFFEDNGILLIRLREKGLEVIKDSDVLYSYKSDPFRLAEKILLILLKQVNLDETKKELIKKYIREERIVNNSEFVKLWDMLPGPIIEDSLYIKNSELAKEWHPIKNGKLTSKDVWANSNKKVWWVCRKGHEWEAVIGSRNSGVGCPYCTGKLASKENCLLYSYPKIAKELHPDKNGKLDPLNLSPGSHKKVWWQCQKGHEWQAVVKHRTNGTGCPYCSGRRATQETCLKYMNSKLSSQWHPSKNATLGPSDVTAGSGKKVWWKCEKGHEWQAIIYERNKGRGCPQCRRLNFNPRKLYILKKYGTSSAQLNFTF